MATYLTGGLRKVIADFHAANPKQSLVNRAGLILEVADYIGAYRLPVAKVIKDAEIEAYYNPNLDRDELVYQAVVKVLKDNEPSDWVLPDPNAHWNSHLPYSTPNAI